MTVISRGISFRSSSNNTPSSPPYFVVIRRKSVHEEKSNEELPAGIGDDPSYFTFVINDDLKIVDMIGWNYFLNNNTLFQHYFGFKNGDVCGGYGF